MQNYEGEKRDFPVPLGWLMFFRVFIVSVLLGISAFVQFRIIDSPFQTSLYPIYTILGCTYLISIVYVFLLRIIKKITVNVYIQSTCDLMLITALVHVTGGVESIYVTLYPLVIIYSVPFIERRGGLFVATLSGIFYALVLGLDYYEILHPLYRNIHAQSITTGYIVTRIFTNVVSFYVVAALAIFVYEQERSLRVLLSDRESAFNRLDRLHNSIIESISAGIITVDMEGVVRSLNRAAEQITDRKLEYVRHRHVDEVFPDIFQTIKKAGNTGMQNFEFTFPIGEGSQKILGFSIHPLLEIDGTKLGFILVCEDLTNIKKMEQEVERTKKLALIGEMTAVLTHELRTPIASIIGSVQLLDRGLNLTGTDKKLMDIMLRGKDQLENLIRDFLLLARPGHGEHKAIDIRDFFSEIASSVRFHPDWNSGIRIEMMVGDDLHIMGNQSEIRQAFWNLIVNAVQAMPDGGTLTILVRKVTEERSDEGLIEISIADTGCGISDDHFNKVMEPFYTTKDTGTGLGLAIVNRVIENHGGTFIIESTPWGGTRCIVKMTATEWRT